MRSLVVRLMDGEEIVEEKRISGDPGWEEIYMDVSRTYLNKLMSNDNLVIKTKIDYR